MKFFKTLGRYALFVMLAAVAVFAVFSAACSKEKPLEEGPETGEYYCDINGAEQNIKLYGGNKFDYNVGGEQKDGEYTLDGENLALVFSDASGQIAATYKNETISFVYNGSAVTFLRKIPYTVTFDTKGGSAVESATVLNGRTVAKPAVPALSGSVFAGWCTDSDCRTAYDFSTPVTSSFTLYARWAQIGSVEYTVKFDLGYSAEPPAPVQTAGGMIFSTPVPQREGFKFIGWWISMSDKADELSFRYESDYVFEENTTLFALWQSTASSPQLASPAVSVKSNVISWEGVSGASGYRLTITGPDGAALVNNEQVGGTSRAFDFSSLAEGDYRVSVVAVASNTANNSPAAVRLYRNRALRRVSIFSVENSVISFRPVADAQNYFISVECGDPAHSHTEVDLHGATSYNFSTCKMQKGGILFTVKATAEGFAPSVSGVYSYSLDLSAATGFSFDEQTQTLSWNAVQNAASYAVTVNGADEYTVTDPSFDIKEYPAGDYEISVTPVTNGYNSPDAAVYNYTKTILATPKEIRLVGYELGWQPVEGAERYDIKIGDEIISVDAPQTTRDLTGKIDVTKPITVRAVGQTTSAWSNEFVLVDTLTITYSRNHVRWQPVAGATEYEVKVNGDAQSVTDGSVNLQISLTNAGENTVSVRAKVNGVWSEPVSVTVFAYTISFDARGGVGVAPLHYAAGDKATLPQTVKSGYSFENWYDREENGALYESGFTVEGDLKLFARYVPDPFTVKLYVNDGNGGTYKLWQEATVYYEQTYKLPVPDDPGALKTFAGWYQRSNGGGTRFTDDSGASIDIYRLSNGTNMFASWTDQLLSFELITLPGTHTQVYSASMSDTLRNDTSGKYKTVKVPQYYHNIPVGRIEDYAFSNCRYIEEVIIPDTIEIISSVNPFEGCDRLKAVTITHVEDNIRIRYKSDGGVLYDLGPIDYPFGSPMLLYVPKAKTGPYTILSGVTDIPMQTFDGCSLSRITVPATVRNIAKKAFSNCKSLASVIFLDPESGAGEPLSIAEQAFYFCENLQEVTLPKRLNDIELGRYTLGPVLGSPASQDVYNGGEHGGVNSAFIGCNLVKLNMTGNGTEYSVKDGVLYNGNQTELVYYPSNLTATSFTVPSGVSKIESGAFLGNTYLKQIEIPNTVTDIGECAFYSCGNLATVIFEGDSVGNPVTIGKYAFRSCGKLQTLTFENGSLVSRIEEGAFFGCVQISEFHAPARLVYMGAQALRGCTNLNSVIFDNGYEPIEFMDDVFYGCVNLTSIRIPSNAPRLPGLGGMDNLSSVIIDSGNGNFMSEGDVIYNVGQTVLYFYPRTKQGAFEIPQTVTEIASGAFENTKALTTINIGTNVTTIGTAAFAGSALTSVIFAQEDGGPLSIGGRAFNGCNGITSVNLPARTRTIGADAFGNMSQLSQVDIKEGVTYIGDGAFHDTKITSFRVPSTVTEIGAQAFANTLKLTSFVFAEGVGIDVIPEGLFSGSGITSVTIPASVTSIEAEAFFASDITTVQFAAESVETIGDSAFGSCAKLKTFNVPASITYIGHNAFYGTHLTTLTFDDGEKDLVIGEQAFMGNSIVTLVFPSRLTELMWGAFSGSSSVGVSCLESVDFGDDSHLKYIGDYAFQSCRRLTSVEIPVSVGDCSVNGAPHYAIGEGAFRACTSLAQFICKEGNTHSFTLGENALCADTWSQNTALTRLVLPAGTTNLGNEFFMWSSGSSYKIRFPELTEITINGEQVTGGAYSSYDGALYNADHTRLISCPAKKDGELILHSSLTDVSANAFTGCTSITEITIPAAWTGLDASLFVNCTSLIRIKVGEPAEGSDPGLFMDASGAILNIAKTEILYYPQSAEGSSYTVEASVERIANATFKGAKNLKTVAFAPRTKDLRIEDEAFSESGIISFNAPATLVSLGARVFAGCESLASFTAGSGCKLTLLPVRTFENCVALTSVEIPEKVTEIPDAENPGADNAGLFHGCIELQTVTFKGNEVTKIGAYAFDINAFYTEYEEVYDPGTDETTRVPHVYPKYSKLSDIVLPSSVTEIGSYAFRNCPELTEITIPAGVNVFGTNVFERTGLQTVTVENGVTEIPEYTFKDCENLNSVTLGDSVGYIGAEAFYGCDSLTGLTFPAQLKTIGARAFANTGLRSADLPQPLTSLGDEAFSGAALTSLSLKGNVTEIGESVFSRCGSLSQVELAVGITTISKSMFEGCINLHNVQFPATIEAIEESAFANSGITSFVAPETLGSIDAYSFSGCSSLTTVQLHGNITSIATYAFENCTHVSELIVPSSVSAIGEGAFSGWTFGQTIVLQGFASESSIPAHWRGWNNGCGAQITYAGMA